MAGTAFTCIVQTLDQVLDGDFQLGFRHVPAFPNYFEI
jgi:hypothetical protein